MRFRETVTLADGTVVVREVEWQEEDMIDESISVANWLERRLIDFFGKVPDHAK